MKTQTGQDIINGQQYLNQRVERKLQTVSTYPAPSILFGTILLLVLEATNCLLTIPS